MKYKIVKIIRNAALAIRENVNRRAVKAIFSKELNLLDKLCMYLREVSEDIFYKAEYYCCFIDGREMNGL